MKIFNLLGMCLLIILLGSFAFYGCAREDTSFDESLGEIATPDQEKNIITGKISKTKPIIEGMIEIEGIGNFKFNPLEVSTIRDDLFNEGYFSIFDILVSLEQSGEIEMEYYFDEELNTYVIGSINGIEGWWYIAYYDGGWPERNVFRMDHYPYKDKMSITIIEASQRELESYYDVFREEIARKNLNGDEIIIPEVVLRGPNIGDLIFENFKVEAHNLRNDMLKEGTVTAIDAIMALGDEGLIDYELFWYESIGTAEIVKNYWVNRINNDAASGRCGFVYEEGSVDFSGFRGNHIHIPSDIRIINSPEYLEYYWICL
ncbi:MAG: hypothetical protein R6U35_06820 [Candidatus Humimicrobiaceae bacterium]